MINVIHKKSSQVLRNSGLYLLPLLFCLGGCEGFIVTGTMCESLQPGEVSTECRPYSEEEAAKASEPSKDDSGECLKCNKAEEVELRR
jgi:hypothetical protein